MRPDPADGLASFPIFEGPAQPLILTHRFGSWDLTRRARVVGILNITPDSFSDGGQFLTLSDAIARAEEMVTEGVDAIDIGGQSTRPGAVAPVGVDEEWARIGPVLKALSGRIPVPLSADTYHGEIARRALDAGVAMVNDVSGIGFDPSIANHSASAGAALILMHSQGAPDRLHDPRDYSDVVASVREFLETRLREAEARGVPWERIALDPGVGFSKRAGQSVDVLRGLPRLTSLGRPLYIGVSRKSFLGALTGAPAERRLAAGLGATVAAFGLGARVFRTHDVRESVDALRVAEALLGAATDAAIAMETRA